MSESKQDAASETVSESSVAKVHKAKTGDRVLVSPRERTPNTKLGPGSAQVCPEYPGVVVGELPSGRVNVVVADDPGNPIANYLSEQPKRASMTHVALLSVPHAMDAGVDPTGPTYVLDE